MQGYSHAPEVSAALKYSSSWMTTVHLSLKCEHFSLHSAQGRAQTF